MMQNEILKLDDISFSYGTESFISGFSLSVEKGSFTTLLGPSGCGKTTLLRLMAGFLKPASGRVFINGNDVTDVPVENRKIGFVFQDFALFPHLTVKQNLLFGFSHSQKKMQIENMEEIASRLELSNLLDRFPHELSGGQQQRVALGRTLMMKPEIILMDEPLSSLDARLRVQVREELLEIQKKIGITTVYVTHDQEESLSLSTRIAVINEGKLLQYDSPRNVYYKPAGEMAARFTGMTNFISLEGKRCMVRPEWISLLSGENSGKEKISGEIISESFLGGVSRYKIKCSEAEGGILTADVPVVFQAEGYEAGSKVGISVNSSVCFDN